MDRRMYRGAPGSNCGCNRNASPYRMGESVCGDMVGDYRPDNSCGRDDRECELKNCALGMCYVPWQYFRNLYENEFAALANGTIFKELDLDWYGRGCK